MSEVVTVLLDGKPYNTHIDEHGVQRFPENAAIRAFIESSSGPNHLIIPGRYSLNDLWIDFFNSTEEEFPLSDMVHFYTQTGYSVSGFCDVFADYGDLKSRPTYVDVYNPLWDDSDD